MVTEETRGAEGDVLARSDESLVEKAMDRAREVATQGSEAASRAARAVADQAGKAADFTQDTLHTAGDAGWRVARQAGETVRTTAAEAFDYGRQAVRTAAPHLQSPWTALFLALAAGGAAQAAFGGKTRETRRRSAGDDAAPPAAARAAGSRANHPVLALGLGLATGGVGWIARQRIEALQEEAERHSSAARDWQRKAFTGRAKLLTFEAQLHARDGELNRLRSDLQHRRAGLEALSRDLRQATEKLAETERKLDQAAAERGDVERRLAATEAELGSSVSTAELEPHTAAVVKTLGADFKRGDGPGSAAFRMAHYNLETVKSAVATSQRPEVVALRAVLAKRNWRASLVRWLLRVRD